jgi:hypothetical protein
MTSLRLLEENPVRHNIDFNFIGVRENDRDIKGPHIPRNRDGSVLENSGVTLGKGIDLGQQSEEGLRKIGVSPETIEKVRPYLGKKKQDALDVLGKYTLDEEESAAVIYDIEKKLHDSNFNTYIDYYEKQTGRKFADLNPKVQTAIGSVISQYGPYLNKRTPKFNNAIINNNVKGMKEELRNFGDKYKTRRNLEADLLEGLSKFNPFGSNAYAAQAPGGSSGVTGSWKESSLERALRQEAEAKPLSLKEKVFSSPVANRLIDILSGGMSIEEAQDMKDEEVERYKTLIKNIPQIATSVAKTNPTNLLSKFISGQEVYTPEEKKAFLHHLDTSLKPLGRIVSPLKEAVHSVLDRKIEEVPQRAVKGFLSPDDTKTITSRVPFSEWEREGSIARLIPRAIAEGVEGYVFARAAFSKPIKGIKQQVKYSQFSRVKDKIKEFTPILEKQGYAKFSPGFTPDQKAEAIIREATKNPKVGDFVNQIIKRTGMLGRMRGQAAQAELPKFNVGDIVLLGKEKAKIIGLSAGKALLDVAGKQITKNIEEVTQVVPTFTGNNSADAYGKSIQGDAEKVNELEQHVAGMKQRSAELSEKYDSATGEEADAIENEMSDLISQTSLANDALKIAKERKGLNANEREVGIEWFNKKIEESKKIIEDTSNELYKNGYSLDVDKGEDLGIPVVSKNGQEIEMESGDRVVDKFYEAQLSLVDYNEKINVLLADGDLSPTDSAGIRAEAERRSGKPITAQQAVAKGMSAEDIDWDAPSEPVKIEPSQEYQGFTDKQLVNDLSDLVSNFEPGQTTQDLYGNYSRLSSGWLSDFSEKGYTQKYLQNIYSKYLDNQPVTEKQSGDLLYTLNAFKKMFGVEPSENIPDAISIDQARASKANLKIAEIMGKMLSKPVPASKVKGIVRKTTGQVKDQGALIPERQALSRSLQRQQQISKKALIEGRKDGEQRIRDVVKEKEFKKKERKELSDEVKKMISFIKNVPTSNLPLEYKDVLDEIKESIDVDKIKLSNVLKKTKERRNLDIDEQLSAQISDIEKINSDLMTVDELREVYDVVQQIYHSGIWADKLIKAEGQKRLSEAVSEGATTILRGSHSDLPPAQRHLKKTWLDMPEELRKIYIAEHRRPEAIFEQFDGFKEGASYNTVFKPIVKSYQDYMRNIETSLKDVSDIFKNVNISNILHSKIDVNGLATGVSRDNLMFIYANSLHPVNRAHLVASGIDQQIIDIAENSLSPEEKKVVHDVIDYFMNSLWPKIDKTYSSLKGVHLKKVSENYFPVMNLEDVGNLDAIEMNINLIDNFIKTGNPGFLKSREPSSDKAYKRYSFVENTYRYISQSNYYSSMAEAVRDAGKYLQHPVIRESIKKAYGEAYDNVLRLWLDDIKRGRSRKDDGFLDTLSNMLRGNCVVSVLGGNISTVAKQPVSFVQGARMIGMKWATKGLFDFLVNPVKAIQFVDGKSIQMKNRAFSQERELQEILAGRGLARRFKQVDLRNIQQMIREGSMFPILAADKATVTALWKGAYDKSISENMDEQKAIDFADKVIRRTQPQSSLIDLPEMFRKGAFKKIITLFRNLPNQNWNLMYDTYVKFGTQTKTAQSFADFMTSNFYYLVLGGLVYGLVDRKRRQESIKEVALDMTNQVTGGMFGFGEVVAKIKYPWGSSNMLDSLVSDISKVHTSKKPETKTKYAGRFLGKVLGVPAYTAIERAITRESLRTKILGGEREKAETRERGTRERKSRERKSRKRNTRTRNRN